MKEKSNNKKLIIGILAVVVLVLAVGMVAFALNNSPAKKLQNQQMLVLQKVDLENNL